MSIDRRSLARIVWNGVLVVAALVAIGFLARYQAVQSPIYETSRSYVESMERAFRRIEAGEAVPADYRSSVDGFDGFELVDSDMVGLIGEFAGRCYVVWQRPGVGAGAGTLGRDLPCMADSRLQFSQTYTDQVVVVPASRAAIDWDRLLPPARTPGWFILVISLLVWLAFNSFVSITIIMYRRRRKT